MRERNRSFDPPRTELPGVRNLASIVAAQAVAQVIGQAYIEAIRVRFALENIDVAELHSE